MSLRSRILPAYLIATGRRAVWHSEETLRRAVAKREAWPSPAPRSQPGAPVSLRDDDGWPLVGLGAPGPRGTLLALHGGGYVFGPDERHWTTWRTLAVRSGRRVVAPLYRLAPEGTAGETVHHAARIAEELAAEGPLAIMGDSAGGGLALAVAQQLRERGVRPPLLLSAPWLDATVSDARSTLARDPWLGADGLRAAATMYAGGLPLTHPLLSPIDADLTDLGPITVASGTRDVLHPDSLRLAERVPGTRLLVGEGLVHNYPILPIPEARAALRAFLAALR